MIEEELKDAEKYIRCANDHKEDYPELADTFYKLSVEEIGHADMLHKQVVNLIMEYLFHYQIFLMLPFLHFPCFLFL